MNFFENFRHCSIRKLTQIQQSALLRGALEKPAYSQNSCKASLRPLIYPSRSMSGNSCHVLGHILKEFTNCEISGKYIALVRHKRQQIKLRQFGTTPHKNTSTILTLNYLCKSEPIFSWSAAAWSSWLPLNWGGTCLQTARKWQTRSLTSVHCSDCHRRALYLYQPFSECTCSNEGTCQIYQQCHMK